MLKNNTEMSLTKFAHPHTQGGPGNAKSVLYLWQEVSMGGSGCETMPFSVMVVSGTPEAAT